MLRGQEGDHVNRPVREAGHCRHRGRRRGRRMLTQGLLGKVDAQPVSRGGTSSRDRTELGNSATDGALITL